MIRNFLIVGGWTMLSRLLGLVRDQLLAACMGAGFAQDAYQVAVRLPNMLRRLFGEGAFNAAFVPLFSEAMVHEGAVEARLFARHVLGIMLVWLVVLCVIGELIMPQILRVIAPGFAYEGARYDLAVYLSRITFPYFVLICAAALVAAVLNGLHRFTMASAAYLAFNVVGIGAIFIGVWYGPSVAIAAAWGVTCSGVVQLGLLLWACTRAGFPLMPLWSLSTPRIRLLLRRMVPGLVGSGISQINLTIDTIIGTLLPTGSVSVMYFADRINQLPLGVLGAAVGTTLLPVLAKHLAAGENGAAHAVQNRSIDYVLLLTLPAVIGLMVLSDPIMMVLFRHGSFSTHDAILSAQSLRAYALGLPAFVMVKVLTPAFFARGDTRTPVYIGILVLVVNLILNLILMKPLAHVGPPLASSLAGMLNVGVLFFLLWRNAALVIPVSMIRRLACVFLAALLMGGGVAGMCYLLPMPENFIKQVFWLGGVIAFGAVSYLFLLVLLRVFKMAYVRAIVQQYVLGQSSMQK
ncbi:MAG: murein biosynthesis integral membrane protein MurJ [Acetobacter sp.]|nr:murein biosynthesis integral membrane protein MurJ [Acetobacter sp.]